MESSGPILGMQFLIAAQRGDHSGGRDPRLGGRVGVQILPDMVGVNMRGVGGIDIRVVVMVFYVEKFGVL